MIDELLNGKCKKLVKSLKSQVVVKKTDPFLVLLQKRDLDT